MSQPGKTPFEQSVNARRNMESVAHKVLVMSGKGGVGKTTLAVNLAAAFSRMGYSVGLLDVDIHGPNVPKMTGTEGTQAGFADGRIVPVTTPGGIRMLSISSFLPEGETAVIWRGPMKIAAIRQFLGDADWGGTEVLVVDCPPGTGDEPLTVAQLLPDSDGAVIVTSPQDVALLDSARSVDFARRVKLAVLGIVENLSGFVCPHCGETTDLFKSGGGEEVARRLDVPFLGRVPISPAMVLAGDSGMPLVDSSADDPAARALTGIAGRLASSWAGPGTGR
jgi:Mrp family chromosome partitioning ATPase